MRLRFAKTFSLRFTTAYCRQRRGIAVDGPQPRRVEPRQAESNRASPWLDALLWRTHRRCIFGKLSLYAVQGSFIAGFAYRAYVTYSTQRLLSTGMHLLKANGAYYFVRQ